MESDSKKVLVIMVILTIINVILAFLLVASGFSNRVLVCY